MVFKHRVSISASLDSKLRVWPLHGKALESPSRGKGQPLKPLKDQGPLGPLLQLSRFDSMRRPFWQVFERLWGTAKNGCQDKNSLMDCQNGWQDRDRLMVYIQKHFKEFVGILMHLEANLKHFKAFWRFRNNFEAIVKNFETFWSTFKAF